MHGTTDPVTRPSLAGAVDAACRIVVSSGEIDALRVTTARRPAYPELVRLKTVAAGHGLVLTVAGDGGVVLRRRAGCPSCRAGGDES